MNTNELDDIRGYLWRILAELREGELDPERAEQQIAAIDSLLDVNRLEHGLAQVDEEPQAKTEGVRP